MNLLSVIGLAILIYIALLIPLFLGVFVVYFTCKQLSLKDVSLSSTIKILGFNTLISFVFFTVFAIFTIQSLVKFNEINSNPYLSIFVLLGVLATFIFFVFIHFKTFFLFVRGYYYNTKLVKSVVLYTITTAITYFILGFYLPVIKFTLIASEIALRS